MTNQVEDKKGDARLFIANILSGLILAALLWVGSNIIDLKNELVAIGTRQAANITILSDHELRLRHLEKSR